MPKRKVPTVEGLVEELNADQEEISTAINEDSSAEVPKKVDGEDINKKREELIKLAEDKEITQTIQFIKRASTKVIDRVYSEYEAKCKKRAASFLCDQFLSKFSTVIGGLDAIEKPEEMEKELKHDPLLRKDVESVLSLLTQWIPFLGLLSGGLSVGKHVLNHKGGQVADGFARGPFGGEKTPEERTSKEVVSGYDTVN